MDETFDMNELAKDYGIYYKITRMDSESDYDYRSRVAGILREKGKIIEAHEAFSGRRYDDPNQGPSGPMSGIMGAMAKALHKVEYHPGDPERQIGDDIAAGVVTRFKDDSEEKSLAAIFDLLGPSDGMDTIEAMRKKK